MLLNRQHSTAARGVALDLLFNGVSASIDNRITFTRASTATYTNSAGLIASAVINAPRIDYDPVTLAAKGLLIEEARTNLLLRSEEFDNATWTKSSTTVTANATTAPDGTATADRLVEVAATAVHFVFEAMTISAGAIYTASVLAKAGGRDFIQLIFDDGSANGLYATFNLTTGVVSEAATARGTGTVSAAATISAQANGFYRLTISGIAGGVATTARIGVVLANAATGFAQSYLGDISKGPYILGAQLEAGAFATSYIPTTSAQVTRAADVAVMTSTNFSSWYNQSAFTLVIKFKGQASGTKSYFSVSDGTANERIELQSVGGTLTLNALDGGVAQAALALSSVVTGTDYTVAIAWAASDFAASVNGGAVVTDGAGTLPTPDRLHIGMDYTAANAECTTTARVTGYPTRLPNATLQALSA